MPFRSLGDQYTGRQCPSGNSVTNTQAGNALQVTRWPIHRPAMPFRSLGDQYTGRQCPSGHSVTNTQASNALQVTRWPIHRPAMPFRSLGDQYTGRQCPSGHSVTNTQTSVRAGNNLQSVASCVPTSHQHNNYNNRDFSGFPSVPPDNFPTTTPPGASNAPSRILSEPPTISLPAIVCSLRYWT